jgi:Tol biopolymer transport system component
MEEFTVDRKKIVWLTALAGALALVCAARNGANVDQLSVVTTTWAATMAAPEAGTAVGIFEGHGDVGTVLHPGAVEFDAAKGSYAIAGSGENMWLASDAFQFAWKKMSGDVTLTADISFLGKGVNEHRKAVLMVRQSLEADSPYADVALHGSGLTSLQYREEKGAATHEIQANTSAPKRVRIEKRGAYFSLWLADASGEFRPASGSTRIALKEPFYVGIGICSHDKDVVEKAVFSNVDLRTAAPAAATATTLYSALEIITVASTDRRAIYVAPERFEAPNWMPDGKTLLFNRNGRIEKIPVTGAPRMSIQLNGHIVSAEMPEQLDTGFAVRCNNDHGISPDGTQLAISDNSQEEHRSLVYIVPIGGGTPRRITQKSPSYWHGWSPDGKTLAFVGERNGDFDIYGIPAAGGEETRLTTAKGLDDGPEYTPDGKYIYFNSERTGHMQIWRMRSDGSEQEQVTFGEDNDWFPHLSPDGQQMVFVTFEPSVKGHPENKDVMLRMMSLKDKKITVLAKLFGGQGTMNVPSWSPDGKQFAFVSYQLVPKEAGTGRVP